MKQYLNCERKHLYENGTNSQVSSVSIRVIDKKLIRIECHKCENDTIVNNYVKE